MNHIIKRLLFRYYALLSLAALVSAILLFTAGQLTWAPLIAIGGGALSLAFGTQKQQLEEMRLFKELFNEFNKRYDAQNEDLNRLYCESREKPLTSAQRDTLFGYFNLCGEEYFYYSQGFIHPEVWNSWLNGMRFFRSDARIRDLWDEELRTGSYYGLSFENEKS